MDDTRDGRLTFRVEPRLIALLDTEARRTERTKSSIIRLALKQMLGDEYVKATTRVTAVVKGGDSHGE